VSRAGADPDLVGRDALLDRLAAVVERAARGQCSTMLVAGQAGIGKTSLIRAAAGFAATLGIRVGWGTCVDGSGAPGYWPWTQALNAVTRDIGVDRARALAGDDGGLVALIVTALSTGGASGGGGQAQLLLMDSMARWLAAVAADGPVMIVLDDLQWADESSLALFEFIARSPYAAAVCLVGAFRDDELTAGTHERMSALLTHADHIQVEGLDLASVKALVEQMIGGPVGSELCNRIHSRSAGHPFFVRELSLLSTSSHAMTPLPVAVREAIERRLRQLPAATMAVIEVAALIGNNFVPDVVGDALALSAVDVELAVRDAVNGAILVSDETGRLRFVHDLLRETVVAGLAPSRRVAIHQSVGTALEHRILRGGDSPPAELARHFAAAIAIDGPDRAGRWALAAAAADQASLAFSDATSHLYRFRIAANDAGVAIPDGQLVDTLLAEADGLARAGRPLDAKVLLLNSREIANRCGDVRRLALVTLASTQLGSRFSARRDDVIRELEGTLVSLADLDPVLEARLTATLARELQHSVAEERPRAGPLSLRALKIGRNAGDPAALLTCLLARHDVLWTPGTATERAEIAREICDVAQRVGDVERYAEGLLLLANADLERGSGAYLTALESCLELLDELGQPRHRYTAQTRRAAVAMLRGDLVDGSHRVDAATELGVRIKEPDTHNVRMSQRLELVRARAVPDELQAFADEAVAHWTGAAVHANAVAAGFHARAGDAERTRRHVSVVLDLGTWRADRSYLWSVFVRELSWAAIALDDASLCNQLFDDVAPLAHTCGVNGAVVAFAGSHAHTAGLLAAKLNRPDDATAFLTEARDVYERLGAKGWLAELGRDVPTTSTTVQAKPSNCRFERAGPVWRLEFGGHTATLPDAKGLADLASLLGRPGTDVHSLALMGTSERSSSSGPLIDRTALQSYRQRLADLDDEANEAELHHDIARTERIAHEREALLQELRRATENTGRSRQFANHPAERARKAVTARIRAAIVTIDDVMPDLAEHLNRTIVTGTHCRYNSDGTTEWDIIS
jgi:hypothetical protein